MTFLDILTTLVGTIMGCANFPQAYRLYKRKQSGSISLITYSVLVVGSLVWLAYGIEKGSFPLIISNIVGFVSTALVLFFTILYRKNSSV